MPLLIKIMLFYWVLDKDTMHGNNWFQLHHMTRSMLTFQQESTIDMMQLLNSNDYYTDWCGDCITAEPIILEEMGNVPSNSIFVHVDIGLF